MDAMVMNECFVCTETDPPPMQSACLCTDRYIHKTCQLALINKCKSASCPACKGRYRNVVFVTQTRMNWYSKAVLMWFLSCMLLLLTGCAVNTGLRLRWSRHLDAESISMLVLMSVIFSGMSGIGWIMWCSFACLYGRHGMSCTITDTIPHVTAV